MSVKLIIAFPFSGRYVSPEWALSMTNLKYPHGLQYGQYATKGMIRDAARNAIVRKALAEDAEYVLFIDDDTAPPPDAVSLLMRELETRDPSAVVCAGIYCSKTQPNEPLVFKRIGDGPYWKWKFGEIFPCEGIATGCMLIRTSVFAAIPEPWFRDIHSIEDVEDPAVFGGEAVPNEFRMTDDLYFCRKVVDAGFTILAHGGVLPVHWDQTGHGHTLPDDAYPVKDAPVGALWYKHYYQKATA